MSVPQSNRILQLLFKTKCFLLNCHPDSREDNQTPSREESLRPREVGGKEMGDKDRGVSGMLSIGIVRSCREITAVT